MCGARARELQLFAHEHRFRRVGERLLAEGMRQEYRCLFCGMVEYRRE